MNENRYLRGFRAVLIFCHMNKNQYLRGFRPYSSFEFLSYEQKKHFINLT